MLKNFERQYGGGAKNEIYNAEKFWVAIRGGAEKKIYNAKNFYNAKEFLYEIYNAKKMLSGNTVESQKTIL